MRQPRKNTSRKQFHC